MTLRQHLIVALLTHHDHGSVGGGVQTKQRTEELEKPLAANQGLARGPVTLYLKVIVHFLFDVQYLVGFLQVVLVHVGLYKM